MASEDGCDVHVPLSLVQASHSQVVMVGLDEHHCVLLTLAAQDNLRVAKFEKRPDLRQLVSDK